MKKLIPLFLYGTIIVVAGVFLLVSKHVPFHTLRYTLGIGLTVGAIFAFITALTRENKQVQIMYHEIHSFIMVAYGMAIIFFCSTVELLQIITASLLILYSVSEFIFSLLLFNLRQDVHYRIVFVRLIIALATGMGASALVYFKDSAMPTTLSGYGVLFLLIGTNVLLYSPVMKAKNQPSQVILQKV